MITFLSSNGKIILFSRAIRSFALGFISIVFGIYLKESKLDSASIGFIISSSVLGGAVSTFAIGRFIHKWGVKKTFILLLGLSLVGVSIFIFTSQTLFLLLASFIAFISPSGRELGPFLSLEQAYLPTTVSHKNRNKAFSLLNMVSHLASSLGALMGFIPSFLQTYFSMSTLHSYKVIFILYFLLNLGALFFYTKLSEVSLHESKTKLSIKTKKVVVRLSLLFSLDSFAGGFVLGSLVSLWMHSKFGVPLQTISVLFFIGGLLETASYYVSGKLSDRFGQINTMVFTHIPANLALISMPFMPTYFLTSLCFLFRSFLSSMDVPARQSYVVSIVSPPERFRVASITNIAKIASASLSPSISGKILLLPFLSPFVMAGILKTIYDLLLYRNFKSIEPEAESIK